MSPTFTFKNTLKEFEKSGKYGDTSELLGNTKNRK